MRIAAWICCFFSLAVMLTALLTGCDRPKERTVDVDAGGHRLHMLISGDAAGRATVVLESGLPGGLGWNEVRWGVAKFARVITYDRAGIGQSETGPSPRDAGHIATELHTVLHNAGFPPPYILVGQSMGGAYIRVFSASYPREVVGLVLVDPVHVELCEPMKDLRAWFALHHPQDWQRVEEVAARAPAGSETMIVSLAKRTEEYLDGLPATRRHAVADEYWSLLQNAPQENVSPELSPGARAEFEVAADTFQQAIDARPMPKVPIILLAAGQPMLYSEVDASLSPSMRTLHEFQKQLKLDDYRAWVNTTPGARLVVARTSGHNIQTDDPQLVINAIQEVADAYLRKK